HSRDDIVSHPFLLQGGPSLPESTSVLRTDFGGRLVIFPWGVRPLQYGQAGADLQLIARFFPGICVVLPAEISPLSGAKQCGNSPPPTRMATRPGTVSASTHWSTPTSRLACVAILSPGHSDGGLAADQGGRWCVRIVGEVVEQVAVALAAVELPVPRVGLIFGPVQEAAVHTEFALHQDQALGPDPLDDSSMQDVPPTAAVDHQIPHLRRVHLGVAVVVEDALDDLASQREPAAGEDPAMTVARRGRQAGADELQLKARLSEEPSLTLQGAGERFAEGRGVKGDRATSVGERHHWGWLLSRGLHLGVRFFGRPPWHWGG